MGSPLLFALLLALLALLLFWWTAPGCLGRRSGFLIYPYLDLDEPGVRGSYYAMSTFEGETSSGRRPERFRGNHLWSTPAYYWNNLPREQTCQRVEYAGRGSRPGARTPTEHTLPRYGPNFLA